MLYEDDLVIIGETFEDLMTKIEKWSKVTGIEGEHGKIQSYDLG